MIESLNKIAILVTRPKIIRPKDRRILNEAGIVIVETDDPQSDVKFITPQAELSNSELFLASLTALESGQNPVPKANLVTIMKEMMEAKRD